MKNKTHRGFSLVEVIIAFSLLTITVIASTNLISDSISNNQENVYRVQAYFLAQEGIELTRAYRDTLWLEGASFLENRNFAIEFKQDEPLELTSVSISTPAPLSLNNNQFTHDPSGSPTSFTRTINIKPLDQFDNLTLKLSPNPDAPDNFKLNKSQIPQETKIVTSTVTYQFRGEPKEVSITTILTNWKQL